MASRFWLVCLFVACALQALPILASIWLEFAKNIEAATATATTTATETATILSSTDHKIQQDAKSPSATATATTTTTASAAQGAESPAMPPPFRTLSVMAIATAFEDFDDNSRDNLQRMIQDRSAIGSVAAEIAMSQTIQMIQNGTKTINEMLDVSIDLDHVKLPIPVGAFPIAFDRFITVGGGDKEVEAKPEGVTLHNTGLDGTPAWVVFDRNRHVLVSWTGKSTQVPVLLRLLLQKL